MPSIRSGDGITAAATCVTLSADQIDAIAQRVAELLHDEPPRARLVDAATLAAALGVSRDFVYAHAEELGGRHIGPSPRSPWRFDLDAALEGWTHRSKGTDPSDAKTSAGAGKARSRRRPRLGSSGRLLPVHGEPPDLANEKAPQRR